MHNSAICYFEALKKGEYLCDLNENGFSVAWWMVLHEVKITSSVLYIYSSRHLTTSLRYYIVYISSPLQGF
ncbi:MAG: hypothetical protein ACI83D_000787 [Planctomycetota bacterium]|jgi:hypothetical protein